MNVTVPPVFMDFGPVRANPQHSRPLCICNAFCGSEGGTGAFVCKVGLPSVIKFRPGDTVGQVKYLGSKDTCPQAAVIRRFSCEIHEFALKFGPVT